MSFVIYHVNDTLQHTAVTKATNLTRSPAAKPAGLSFLLFFHFSFYVFTPAPFPFSAILFIFLSYDALGALTVPNTVYSGLKNGMKSHETSRKHSASRSGLQISLIKIMIQLKTDCKGRFIGCHNQICLSVCEIPSVPPHPHVHMK